jgi:hypothetical protein
MHRDELHTPYSKCWDDLLSHGLLHPLNLILITGLLENNPRCEFPLSETVGSFLGAEDLVLNLNYDLIFDVALKNIGKEAVYSPNSRKPDRIWAFKPHGSFHLAVNEAARSFYFGQVELIGDVQPSDGSTTYSGFIPPRAGKSFSQNPWGKMIVDPLLALEPEVVSFWGVGSPASDIDLFEAYKKLCATASEIEYINPSIDDARNFEKLLGKNVTHFESVGKWLG